MPITFTPAAIQRISQSTYDAVYNRMNPGKVDRRMMPGLALMSDTKESVPTNANKVHYKYKIMSGIQAQGWERKDHLEFSEQDVFLDVVYELSNVHHGYELVHDDFEAACGGTIIPNQWPRGKDIVKMDSKGDLYRLVNAVKEEQESFMDARNVNLDKMLWQSNSTDPKLPSGFDAYWPRGTPTANQVSDAGGTRGYYATGSIGGRLRSQFPDVLQHYIWLNATATASGSLRVALNTAKYEAELRSRGRTRGGIKKIVCGRNAALKWVQFMQLNGLVFWADANKSTQVDGGLPTSNLHFEGIPMEINPTFALLDQIESQTYKWDDCFFLIDNDAFCWGYAAGKDAVFSAAPDESDQRITRFSIDDKFLLLPKVPNAISIVHVA